MGSKLSCTAKNKEEKNEPPYTRRRNRNDDSKRSVQIEEDTGQISVISTLNRGKGSRDGGHGKVIINITAENLAIGESSSVGSTRRRSNTPGKISELVSLSRPVSRDVTVMGDKAPHEGGEEVQVHLENVSPVVPPNDTTCDGQVVTSSNLSSSTGYGTWVTESDIKETIPVFVSEYNPESERKQQSLEKNLDDKEEGSSGSGAQAGSTDAESLPVDKMLTSLAGDDNDDEDDDNDEEITIAPDSIHVDGEPIENEEQFSNISIRESLSYNTSDDGSMHQVCSQSHQVANRSNHALVSAHEKIRGNQDNSRQIGFYQPESPTSSELFEGPTDYNESHSESRNMIAVTDTNSDANSRINTGNDMENIPGVISRGADLSNDDNNLDEETTESTESQNEMSQVSSGNPNLDVAVDTDIADGRPVANEDGDMEADAELMNGDNAQQRQNFENHADNMEVPKKYYAQNAIMDPLREISGYGKHGMDRAYDTATKTDCNNEVKSECARQIGAISVNGMECMRDVAIQGLQTVIVRT